MVVHEVNPPLLPDPGVISSAERSGVGRETLLADSLQTEEVKCTVCQCEVEVGCVIKIQWRGKNAVHFLK